MNSEKHNKIVTNKKKQLEASGNRVIRLDSGYLPDLISINWDTRKVEAVELEARTTRKRRYFRHDKQWERSAKTKRDEFDSTVVIMPKNGLGKTFYLPSQYLKSFELKDNGKSINEISIELNIPKVTVRSWFKGTKPWSVKRNYDETLGNITFEYY